MTTPRPIDSSFLGIFLVMRQGTGKRESFQSFPIFKGAVRWFGFSPMTLLYLKPKVARGNHRTAEGFLGQIARYAKTASRGNPLFLKP